MNEEFSARLRDIVGVDAPGVTGMTDAEFRRLLQAGGDSLPGLLALVRDRKADVVTRRTACWVLGQLGDERAVPALSAALRDRSPRIRAAGVRALAAFGARHAVT